MEKMTSVLKTIGTKTKDFFRKTEKKKLIFWGIVAAVVITAGIVGAVLLNRVQYTTLYSGLSAEDAGNVMTKLKDMGVTAKAEGTDTILVPDDQADELRIELASQGYPKSGLNYDLFSSSSSLGSTDLQQQTYLQYQLQENMRKTISHMDKVNDCIVMVNLASNSSFVKTDNTSDASVAVLLELKDGEKLTNEEAQTIGNFVLKCVPKLKKENISIVDSQMNSYSITSDDNDGDGTADYSDAQQKLTEQMKKILSDQVLRVLQPAVGSGNVAVSVNLNLDFDKKTENSVDFAPPVEGESQGLLISSQEIYNGVTAQNAASGETGTDSNGVSASEYVAGSQQTGNNDSYTKTYNYELNKIQTQIENAQGTVKDLSVAVLLNGDVKGIDGYQDKIKNLVANAIGVKPDYISIEFMPFQESPSNGTFADYLAKNQETVNQMTKSSLIRAAIFAAAAILIAFMVLKFLRWKNKPEVVMETAPEETLNEVGGVPTGTMESEESQRMLQEIMNQKSDAAKKVEELMEKYPDAVVQTLRSWLLEDR